MLLVNNKISNRAETLLSISSNGQVQLSCYSYSVKNLNKASFFSCDIGNINLYQRVLSVFNALSQTKSGWIMKENILGYLTGFQIAVQFGNIHSLYN